MSYGWLTESALLPTRAVPIRGVSNTSLLSLSNQIFSLQQEQQDQQQQGLRPQAAGATAAGATPAGAGGVKRKRPPFRSRSASEEESDFGDACPPRSEGGGGDERDKRGEDDAAAGGHGGDAEGAGKEISERWQSGGRRKLLRAPAAEEKTKTSEGEGGGNEQEGNLFVSHATSRKTWKKPSRKPKTREELLLDGKNARVEERAAKDEVHYKAAQKTLAASRRRLEEKARLYEELVSGRLDSSSAPAGARLVVDFEEKLWRRSSASAPSIKDNHVTDEQKTESLNLEEPEGEAAVDLLGRYFSVEEQDRRQQERQNARTLRLDCLRSRLISLREAAVVAARSRTAAAGFSGDSE